MGDVDTPTGPEEVPIPPRLDTATTCLTRCSSRTIRCRKAAFSCSRARVVEGVCVNDGFCEFTDARTGFTSSSHPFGGGATDAKFTPPAENATMSAGIPRSLASESTDSAGDGSRGWERGAREGGGLEEWVPVVEVDLGAAVGFDSPRNRRFSASSSATRFSRLVRWALR